jgi:hypothetical protein
MVFPLLQSLIFLSEAHSPVVTELPLAVARVSQHLGGSHPEQGVPTQGGSLQRGSSSRRGRAQESRVGGNRQQAGRMLARSLPACLPASLVWPVVQAAVFGRCGVDATRLPLSVLSLLHPG